MACNPEVLKHVPLFALLDEEETAVLAGQVRLKTFAPRQRIYKIGDSGGQAYVVVSGRVRVATVDQDQQEVVVDEPWNGEGGREGRWVLLDYLEVVIHVQHSEERSFYSLERIWKDCPQIPLPELVSAGPGGRTQGPPQTPPSNPGRTR